MKISDLYVADFEFIDIFECNIYKTFNSHCEATIKGQISDRDVDKYLNRGYFEEWVQVIGITEDKEKIELFYGYIKDYSVSVQNGLKALELTLVSKTYLYDLQEKLTTFQNVTSEYTYKNLVDNVIMGRGSYFINQLYEKPVGEICVQYEESDWAFIKRMASNNGTLLIAMTSMNKPDFYFGLPELGNVGLIDEILVAEYHFMGNEVQPCIVSRHHYELAEYVSFKNEIYCICEVKRWIQGGEIVNQYLLRFAENIKMGKYKNEKIIGASIEAYITDVQADRVKVMTVCDTISKADAKWFAYATVYSSPDGTGWYCMPEIGDRVRLYFPSMNEEDAYVISSVHETSGDTQARSNPNEKSLKTKDGKEILLTPEKILITNNNGMLIEMNDETGISIVSDKNIDISSTDSVSIVSQANGINMIGAEQVALRQNASSIVLNNDIILEGGKIRTM